MNKKVNTICYMLMLFLGIYLAMYQNSINYITEGVLNKSTIMGVLVALHFIGIIIAPVTFGEAGDRIGKKKVLTIAFATILFGISIVFVSKSIILVAVGILFIGCGFGAIESLGSSILADENPYDTNRVINISQVFFSAGAVMGPLISLKIVEISGSWKISYLIAFIFFASMLVATSKTDFGGVTGTGTDSITSTGAVSSAGIGTDAAACKDTGSVAVTTKKTGLYSSRLLKDRYFQILCLSIFLYVGIEGASSFWITTYFRDVLGAEKLGSYALSGFWGSMIVGRYIGSKLESKSRIVMNISLVISIVSITSGLLIKSTISGLVSFTLLGFGFAVIWPVLMTMAAKRYPEKTGTAMGIMMTISAVGGMIIPFIMGILGDALSISAGLSVVPASALLIILLQFKAVTVE